MQTVVLMPAADDSLYNTGYKWTQQMSFLDLVPIHAPMKYFTLSISENSIRSSLVQLLPMGEMLSVPFLNSINVPLQAEQEAAITRRRRTGGGGRSHFAASISQFWWLKRTGLLAHQEYRSDVCAHHPEGLSNSWPCRVMSLLMPHLFFGSLMSPM